MTPATAILPAVATPVAEQTPVGSSASAVAGAVAGSVRVDIWVNGRMAEAAALPADVADLQSRLSSGQVVTLVPTHAEVALSQAADLLSVSLGFVTQRVVGGELPARGTGTARVVRFEDVIAYKRRSDAAAEGAARELTREAESLGLYDRQPS